MSEIAGVSTVTPATPARPSRALSIGLWVAQVLLAALFGMAGFMKSFTPIEELVKQMPFAEVGGGALVRFIGISELAGAVGLILPALTRIKPVLTGLAGLGLTVVMVLAIGYHLVRYEFSSLPMNIVLGGLAAFVAWGRLRRAPIAPRA